MLLVPILLVLLLLLMAFFSGMEIAFVSSNKLRIELDKKQGGGISRIVSWLSQRIELVVATTLVGTNVCLVVFSYLMAEQLEPLLEKFIRGDVWILLIQTLVATIIILFTAEFLPKTIFRARSNRMLKLFSVPFLILFILLYPVTWFVVKLSDFLLRKILKSPGSTQLRQRVFSKVDLNNLVEENLEGPHSDESPEQEIKLFQNALDFSSVRLRDCMIPRTEIEAVPADTTLTELRDRFIETGYSRILVFNHDIDHITGYVHHSDLFRNPADIRSILRKVTLVTESMQANKLLTRMLHLRQNLAVVIDEFGGTAGLVTTEDILEEIFGEIEDEHDAPQEMEKKTGDDEYLFSARLEIDYLNETYHLGLPVSDEYETLAGMILYHYNSFPRVNETIRIEKFTFRILRSSRKKIDLVSLKVTSDE
ncbi:MAG: hemolysin family protein [Bacteroidota bacterium]